MSEFDYIPSNIVAAEFEATPHYTEGNEEPTIFYECVALLTQVAREWTEHELSIPAAPEAIYKLIRPAKGYILQAGQQEVTGPSLDGIAAKGSFWQVGLSGATIHARYHRGQWDSLPEDTFAGWRPTLHDLAQKLWPDLAPSQEEPQHDLSMFQSLVMFCDQQGYDISEWEQDHETEPQGNYGTDEEPVPAGWSLDPQDWPNCCPFHGEYQSSLAAHAMPCGSVLWGQGFTVDVEGSRFTIWGECVEDNSDSDDDCYEEVCHACGEDKDDDEIHHCNDCDKMWHSQCDEYEMMQYAEDDDDDGVTLCSACVDERVLDRVLRRKSPRLKPLRISPPCDAYTPDSEGKTKQCRTPSRLLFIADHLFISSSGQSFNGQREHPVCLSCAEKAIDADTLRQERNDGLHPMFARPAFMLDSEKVYWSAHPVKPAWKKTVTERYYNCDKTVFADFLDGRGIVMLNGPESARYWSPCGNANYSYDRGDLKVFFYGPFFRQWRLAKGPRAKVEGHYQSIEGFNDRSWS